MADGDALGRRQNADEALELLESGTLESSGEAGARRLVHWPLRAAIGFERDCAGADSRTVESQTSRVKFQPREEAQAGQRSRDFFVVFHGAHEIVKDPVEFNSPVIGLRCVDGQHSSQAARNL